MLTSAASAQTSWKGTTSTSWKTASNWTAGVPSSTVDAIIGDANFTGSFQPRLTSTSSCKNLTVGGSVTATLTIAKNLNVFGDVVINSNGTILENTNNQTITVKGNWTNSGTFTASGNNVKVTFTGTAQSLTGATTFKVLTINSSSTLTLASNISVGTTLTVSGALNPASYVVSGAGALTVNSTGILFVYASTFAGNYTISGTKTLNGTSTVNYASSSTAQTVSNALTYGILRISGGSTKSLSGNLPGLNSSNAASGKIYIDAGIFDLSTFTAARSSSGGEFTIAVGAQLKIGGTNSFPANYSTLSFASTSTVEYSGAAQTVIAAPYGNLTLSSSSGSVTKTLPATAFTIAGNFTMSVGAGTAVACTAGQNITVNKEVTIGSGCTFNGSSFSHTFKSNWINNGTFTGSTSTVTFTGVTSILSGSGTNNFSNLTLSATGITASGSTAINVSGNLATSAPGAFTHASGGSVTMTGASKTISGNGFEFANLVISGSVTTAANINIYGNLTNNGTFAASGGVITMNGASKVLNGSSTTTFYTLSIEGSITTAIDFTVLANLSVAISGSFTASAGTATFNGVSSFSGTANLYNVTINASRTLTMGSSAILGIANTFTKTGTLDVTTLVPNTIVYNSTGAQNVVSATYHNLEVSNGNTKTPLGAVTVNNDFTIKTGTTFNGSSYVFSLYRHWNNNGTFTAATSDIQLRGINAATITGATTFRTLTVNKSTAAIRVTLANNVSATDIVMTTGNIATGVYAITTTSGRTGNGIIIGTVIHSHSFTNGTAYSFEGPNNLITFTNPSGITSVTVTSKLGAIADFDPTAECVLREYIISVPSGTYTSAKLRFHYENNELNAFSEPYLAIYKYNSGITWDSIGFVARDTGANYLEQSGITALGGRFTSSGIRNTVRWNGTVSSAWNNAANWTTISGTSMANRVPTVTDAAYIGDTLFVNQPIITTSEQISLLRFGSVKASTLTINGGSLRTEGSAKGKWATSRSHIIDVASGSLNIGTNLLLSDSVSGHDITLKIGTGTVTVSNDFDQTATGAVDFTGNGTLNLNGNYNYVGGSFTAGTGTVVYSGGGAQKVAPVTYNNLTISKSTERASFNSPTRVLGNLTTNTGGEVVIFDTLTVAGNITIGTSTFFYNQAATIKIGGNWLKNGNFISENGTTRFNGTGNQTVNGTTFSNLIVDKVSGELTLTQNLVINSTLTITAGTLALDTFMANRSSDGGVFTIGSGATLKVGGANNFPDNFISNVLNVSSNVNYNGTIAQTIRKVNYGNLLLTNGGSLAKSLIGNIQINGNLTINSGATYNPGINSTTLYGNYVNNGTYTPGTSTLILNGTTKTFTGTSTLYSLYIVTGSYTVSSGSVSMAGDFYIESTGSLDFGSNNASLDGDFTNKGSLTSNGTSTFTGTRVQTIQLINSITSSSTGIINFNGSVSPIINSTSSPAYATVNINNTAGVTASVPWFVFVAFNVASGATFNGGPLTHTFYGNFTNNGTVTSSGKLKFTPGAPYSSSATITLDGTSFISTGEVEFAGTGAITIVDINPVFNIVKITNTNAAGVTPPNSWTIPDELSIASGATFNGGSGTSHLLSGSMLNNGVLDGQTSTFRFDGAAAEINGLGVNTFNHLKIESTGSLTINRGIYIKQNFIVDGVFTGDGRPVIFTGTSASTISGAASSVVFGDFEQDKTNTTTTLSLPISITGDLTMTNGIIVTTATNILTVEDDGTSTAGNANSFVSGPMKKVGNDSFIFPLGKGTKWARLGIEAPASITDAFTAQYFNTPYTDTLTMAASPTPVLNNVSKKEYWTCDRTVGTSNIKIQLFWENFLSGINYYTPDLVVARWNGSAWENKGQSAITTSTPGNVTSNTINSFSPFTFGSLSGINILPVTLLNFTAKLNKSIEVELVWQTTSEINNDFFTVERSRDGINFEFVEQIKSAGNSNDLITYSTKDLKPYSGVSYYRLKQTDKSGEVGYSKVEVVVNESPLQLVIYPNPSNQSMFYINGLDNDARDIEIRNLAGQLVYSEYHQINNAIETNLTSGVYIVSVTIDNTTYRFKWIIQ
ncbi:MAG: T9SS type A sorting domain-containing protein [Bacteroidota bacterium]